MENPQVEQKSLWSSRAGLCFFARVSLCSWLCVLLKPGCPNAPESLEADPFYSGKQSDCYFDRYVSNDFTVTVLSPGANSLLEMHVEKHGHQETCLRPDHKPHPWHRLHPANNHPPPPSPDSPGEQSSFSGTAGARNLCFGKRCEHQNRLSRLTVSRSDLHPIGKDCLQDPFLLDPQMTVHENHQSVARLQLWFSAADKRV